MRVLSAIFLLVTGMAQAAPETSLRPETRPARAITVDASGSIPQRARDPAADLAASRGRAMTSSLRPEMRPRAFRAIAQAQQRLRARGAVCEDLDIQGQNVGRVSGSQKGCGIADAVKVRTVAGITLSQQAVMDCNTARALKSWIEQVAKPTLAGKGGGLKRLRVAAHYACRTRNNRPGGRISEHGKGRAIDISAVRLQDGTLITVRTGWNDKNTAQAMRRLHAGACGPFGTVLGPQSDRYHLDHFHFDTARYRSGPYCR